MPVIIEWLVQRGGGPSADNLQKVNRCEDFFKYFQTRVNSGFNEMI